MKRYHCWPEGKGPGDGRGMDADTPEHAAEAYVEFTDKRDAEYKCVPGDPEVVRVRAPGRKAVRVRVTGEAVPKYTSEVIEPREES